MLAKLKRKLTVTVEELDKVRLQDRYQGLDVTAIGDAPLREPIRLAGEVQETRVVPRAGAPSVEVTIGDGSGRRHRGVHRAHPGAGPQARGRPRRRGRRPPGAQPADAAEPQLHPLLTEPDPRPDEQRPPGRRPRRSSADEDAADVVLALVGHQHEHLVAAVQDGVAAGHDHVVLAHDGHDGGVAGQVELLRLACRRPASRRPG